jgi:uncharacterized GH25 family protein
MAVGFSANLPAQSQAPVAAAPAASVAGKVVDSKTGQGLANAEVFLVYSSNRGITERLIVKGMTDSGGRYEFTNAITWPTEPKSDQPEYDSQRYYVFAVHPEKGMSFAVVLPNDPLTDVNVRLVTNKVNTVKVVDKDGKPVAGVAVHYSGGGITEKDAPDWDRYHRSSNLRHDVGVLSAITDENGEVKLPGLYDGCNYVATKEGYAPNYGETSIPLLPGRKVTGKVTYSDGKPAAGAVIKVVYSGPRLVWDDTTEADAEGRYAFETVPASGFYYGFTKKDPNTDYKGTLTVSAKDAVNDQVMSKPVTFEAKLDDTAARDIVLEKGLLFGGRIVDDRTGKPLAGIRLEGYRRTEDQNSYQNLPEMTTDADGRFQTGVPPGSIVMLRWADSREGSYVLDREWMRRQSQTPNYEYQPIREEKMTADKNDIELKMRLWDVQPMDGVVVDDKGQPVKAASVHLNTHIQPIKTDADGKFVLKAAAKDRDFELCIMSADKSQACLVKVAKGTTSQQFQLKPTVSKVGIVKTPGGVPADNLSFYMDLELNGEAHYYVRIEPKTDRQGRFSAAGLIPGAKYGIFWTTDNETNRDYSYGSAKVDLAAIKGDEPIQFTAKKYVNALMGKIVDDKGNPVANASITVEPGNDLLPQESWRGGNASIATVGKDGSFTIPRLADGKLTFKVAAAGFKTMSFAFPTDEVDAQIKLRPISEPCVYRAKVIDSEGKPVAEATVVLASMRVTRDGKKEEGTRQMKTDANGIANFVQPATAPTTQPVQYNQTMMVCDMPGYDLAISLAAQMGEDLDVELTLSKSSSHWKGKVADSAGKPIEGAVVKITGYRPAGTNSYVRISTLEDDDVFSRLTQTTTADGAFELLRLPGDAWVNFDITSPGKRTLHGYFDPNGDKGGVKSFAMQQGFSLKGRIVVKATGEPLAIPDESNHMAHVIIYKPDGNASAGAQPKSDGAFSTDELEPGTYTARFAAFGNSDVAKWVTVDPPKFEAKVGQALEIVLYVEEGITFKGTIKNLPAGYGSDVREGYVSANRSDEKSYSANSRIAKDGTFTMYLPGAGKYTLQYAIPDASNRYQQKDGGTITVEAGKPVEELTIEYKP